MKKGFTLAEILITLGIIGVVAALTIPGLMTAYRKKVIETRLEKFYSTLNQAIRLAEYDYDDKSGWDKLGTGFIQDEEGNDTDEEVALAWVKKYLIPYIKADNKKVTNKYGTVQLYFQDGSMVDISSASWIFYTDATKYKKLDHDGQVEATGKYAFTFYFGQEDQSGPAFKYVGKGLEPYKWNWDGTREGLFNGKYGCGKEGVVNAYCTELIKQSGWKIPNDYPIKI